MEGHEQQQEREAEHEQEDLRHAVLVEADDVGGVGRVAGHERLDPGQTAEDPRHDLGADVADDLAVRDVVLATGHHIRHERDAPVLRRLGLDRAAQAVAGQQIVREPVDGLLGRRLVRLGDHDLELQRRALGPLLVHEVDGLDAIDRIGERGEVALPDVQAQDR